MAPHLLRPLSEYPLPQDRLRQAASMIDSLDRLEVPVVDRAVYEREILDGIEEARSLFVMRLRAA